MFRSPFREKPRMTTRFKKPGNWAAGYHTGEDWVCDTDKTLVSPCDGTIISNRYDVAYGNMVIIRTVTNQVILMAHMKSRSSAFGKIKEGNVIGIMGNTGNSFGAHLHIEVQNSPSWSYNKNILKPSNYIDFNDFKQGKTIKKQGEDMIYTTLNNVPEWGKATVQLRIDLGAIKDPNKMSVYDSNLVDWVAFDRENPYYKNIADVPDYWLDDVKALIADGSIRGDGFNQIAMRHSELKPIIVAKRMYDSIK